MFNGETIVDSTRAMIMRETRLAPAFYFPRDDVRMDLLSPTERRTNCPFKGNASYWNITVGQKTARNAAWSYEDAYDEAAIVKDYVAFYWSEMDRWLADDDELKEQPKADATARSNPLVDWLVHDASMNVVDSHNTPVMAITMALAVRGEVVDKHTGECMWLPDGRGTWQAPPREQDHPWQDDGPVRQPGALNW